TMSRGKIFILFLLLAAIGLGFYLVPRNRPFESYTQRAIEAFQLKEFERSIELYLKALKLFPNHPKTPQLLLTIGDTYNFSLNNPEKAGKAYEMLTQGFAKSPEARIGFEHAGEMFEKIEDYQKALLAYQGILDNFPEAPNQDLWRYRVAMMAIKMKKFEPGRRSLMAIIDKNPETPIADQVLLQIGNAFFMEGATRHAVEVLNVAAQKFPESPLHSEMLFTLATAYEEVGQLEKALQIYKSIRSSYPNSRVVEKKIEKIASRYQETKLHEANLRQEAKKALMPRSTTESQPSTNLNKRKKNRPVDKTFLKLMEGES
ncbi:MAG TPA: hypothetical protein DF383_02255, partial [Deltaproteobacteria bacterium]|nr:hypothetical protein [Deltaproteobacteria bacterium]